MTADVPACRPEELAEWRRGAEALALLDVREPSEYDTGHLAGASLLWPRTLETRLARLVPSARTRVVLYDDGTSGRALHRAVDCRHYGYERVHWLEGGIKGGATAGYALVSGTNVPSKTFGEGLVAAGVTRHISPAELDRRVGSGDRVVLFDVRTAPEYESGHLPGAVNVGTPELALRLGDVHGADVVVNCAGRTRSLIAAATLSRLGARSVTALENGTMGWLLDGRQLERGPGARPAPATPRSVALAGRAASRLLAGTGVGRMEAATVAGLVEDPARNAYLFDVRTEEEFASGHPSGAVCAPGGQLIQRVDDFVAVASGDVILCDDNEIRAMITAYWLHHMGLPNVSVLADGIEGWRRVGLAVSAGSSAPPPLGRDDARRLVSSVHWADLAAELEAGVVVVNVDSSARFAAGHVPGSVWIPRGWLELRLGDPLDSGRPIVVCCHSGVTSMLAAASLLRSGRSNVRYLEGGTEAWIRSGSPVEKGPAAGGEPDVVPPPYERGDEAMRAYLRWEVALGDPPTRPTGGGRSAAPPPAT